MTTSTTLREVFHRLKDLAALDAKLLALDRQLAADPARLSVIEAEAKEVERKIKAAEERILILRAQVKLRENELKTVEQKLERVKGQASEVRTNKEFMAYRAEVSNFQAEVDRLSGEILKILDVVQQGEAKVTALQADRAKVLGKADDARRVLLASLGHVQRERDSLAAQRPALVKGIPGDHLAAYERVRSSRGNALSVVDGEYCSACMELLTRNDAISVQNAARFVQCRGCNRILVPA